MQEQKLMTAFVDESGTPDLDVEREGVVALFVLAGVVVESSVLEQANQLASELRTRFFGVAEMKSSVIGSNHKRRLAVLEAIASLPIGYYATVIDKAQIYRDSGHRFKPSFYKSMSRMLYERLLQGIASLHIVADRHGSKEFMDSFGAYLQSKSMPLFTTWSHEFQESVDTPLIQVADIIAGSLAWCFDPSKDCSEYRERFLNALHRKELGVERWPRRSEPIPTVPLSTLNEWDSYIRISCQNTIVDFIDRFSCDSNDDRRIQVATLRHMMLLNEHATAEGRAIRSGSIIDYLTRLGFESIDGRKLRQTVIGPLRDAGVIIAGDSNGYRLVMSVQDVNLYIRHDCRVIEPMMARLKKARSLLKMGTANKYDMLDFGEFTVLRAMAETFSTISLQYRIAEPLDIDDEAEDGP